MSMTIDRRRDRAIIKVKRKDRLYGTGQMYQTSISVDLGLIEFTLRVFNGDRSRLIAWIGNTVESVDSTSVATEGSAGFSRLVQREMLRLLGRQCTVRPLGSDESPTPKRRRSAKKNNTEDVITPLQDLHTGILGLGNPLISASDAPEAAESIPG